jgi:two-component system NtrC family response regulator
LDNENPSIRTGGESKPALLIVEDDPGLQKQLRWSLDAWRVVFAADRAGALAQLRRHQPALVTLDLGLPPDPDGASEGLATLDAILALAPDTKVVVLTGNQGHEHALRAIALGAYDFLQKPADPAVLALVLQRAAFLHGVQQENRRLAQWQSTSPLAVVISRSPAMLKLCRHVERVAPTSASVMLLGESGTGKEVLARALHALSPRADGRFMAINCAAIPDQLLESELFGYEKGAFTGAARQTRGKVELAQGGTFFLDEVGDLPLALQAKMLRFLQQRVIERLGGHEEIAVDVRIVCATHQDLRQMIAQGRFREDLYYRLAEIALPIPPLRERTGDAVLLAYHFKNIFCAQERRARIDFSDGALAAIAAWPWPGNVREMENCIKRAVIMADGPQILADDLGMEEPAAAPWPSLRQVRDEAERQALVAALVRCEGSIVRASELLGVSRPTMYDLMNRHDVQA